jgi:hypothetical protein
VPFIDHRKGTFSPLAEIRRGTISRPSARCVSVGHCFGQLWQYPYDAEQASGAMGALPHLVWRNQPKDRAPAAENDETLSSLDPVDKLGESPLRCGDTHSLNHVLDPLIRANIYSL